MSLYKWVVHGFTAANGKMARFVHKHTPSSSSATKKLVFLISCAGLLGAALIADFIWASSSSSAYLSIASNWALEKTGIVVVSNQKAKTAGRVSPSKTGIFFFLFLSFSSGFVHFGFLGYLKECEYYILIAAL